MNIALQKACEGIKYVDEAGEVLQNGLKRLGKTKKLPETAQKNPDVTQNLPDSLPEAEQNYINKYIDAVNRYIDKSVESQNRYIDTGYGAMNAQIDKAQEMRELTDYEWDAAMGEFLETLDERKAAEGIGEFSDGFAKNSDITGRIWRDDAAADAEKLTEGAGDAGKIADGGNNAKFTYKNNPMENTKAEKDIIENSNAVYGYSPNTKSDRIGKFAEFDWTNKDIVSSAREARLQYHKDNETIYNLIKGMQRNGATLEEIAMAANQQRNMNRLQSYIDTGNIYGYGKAVESNMKNFHNKLGMTADQAYDKYCSWDIVLEKAMSANAGMDACCGLYDDFYYLYLSGR